MREIDPLAPQSIHQQAAAEIPEEAADQDDEQGFQHHHHEHLTLTGADGHHDSQLLLSVVQGDQHGIENLREHQQYDHEDNHQTVGITEIQPLADHRVEFLPLHDLVFFR